MQEEKGRKERAVESREEEGGKVKEVKEMSRGVRKRKEEKEIRSARESIGRRGWIGGN